MTTLAERLYVRFAGLLRAHGSYDMRTVEAGKKKKQGAGATKHEPLTIELWQQHLAGTYGLGIVPIRDDNTVRFGAIDVDQYDLDLEALEATITTMGLPLVVCRTKSGGAHLYLFCSEDITAELVRGRLMEWAVALGHSGSEVFPKQIRLAGPNDVGNWINMPYFGGESSDRYAIDDGQKLTVEEFLELAEQRAVEEEQLQSFVLPQDQLFQEWFLQAPPCLQTLAKRGFGEGGRNIALFNIGVYLRKRFGENLWEGKLDEFNQKFMSPALGHKEVAQIVKNVSKKAYEYTCSQPPIVNVCNKQICLTREFGVGSGDQDPGVVFGRLTKIEMEPPLWIWAVNSANIELTTADLKDQSRFHTRSIEVLNIWPKLLKPQTWSDLIRDRLAKADIQPAPPEASPRGQMWTMLESYCTGQMQAKSKEELLLGKPWTDPETGRTWFSGSHFKKWLDQQRFHCTNPQLWGWLRSYGAEHIFVNIKGKGRNYWTITSFAGQLESFSMPEVPDESI